MLNIRCEDLDVLGADRVRSITGSYRIKHHCKGKENGCVRNGDCSKHYWSEEVLESDEVTLQRYAKDKYGNGTPVEKQVRIPIRYYNYQVACLKVLDEYGMDNALKEIKEDKTAETRLKFIGKALDHAQANYFMSDGTPADLAERMEFSSYNKLLNMVEKRFNSVD